MRDFGLQLLNEMLSHAGRLVTAADAVHGGSPGDPVYLRCECHIGSRWDGQARHLAPDAKQAHERKPHVRALSLLRMSSHVDTTRWDWYPSHLGAPVATGHQVTRRLAIRLLMPTAFRDLHDEHARHWVRLLRTSDLQIT